jgi:hypothetical protein
MAIQNMAAIRSSRLPASISSTTDIGTGGCQCQPHQLVGLFSALMSR